MMQCLMHYALHHQVSMGLPQAEYAWYMLVVIVLHNATKRIPEMTLPKHTLTPEHQLARRPCLSLSHD